MFASRQPITIVGGGLAGLTLGVGLRRHGIAVELFESRPYPHHRVCGEFIAGLNPHVLESLGITELFDKARHHKETTWFHSNGKAFHQLNLPNSALGISRHFLDHALAERFTSLGGSLFCHRWRDYDRKESVVYTTGRKTLQKAKPSPWVGLKVHVYGLTSSSDLEMHLGRGGYVGASQVEGDAVNICGLFPRQAVLQTEGPQKFEAGLEVLGLHHLRSRIQAAEIDNDSRCGTTHFIPGRQKVAAQECVLGDSFQQIPPFTGHGMAMAMESATLSVPWIVQYTQGHQSWTETVQMIRYTLHQHFATRIRWARLIHPLLYSRMITALPLLPETATSALLAKVWGKS